ncbi:hypothetical protein HMPREF3156_01273 [Neisseria sp. HMSC06F02]|nr:hypothetical protein HMPREF3156_01273 [Neisseria sp. HMSC06F02]
MMHPYVFIGITCGFLFSQMLIGVKTAAVSAILFLCAFLHNLLS